jgi:CheY-like chemotaxis protein
MASIVVIEQDWLMRSLLVEWLSAEGYSVRAAGPCDPAYPGETDLLIVDVFMPRREGAARIGAIKAAYPDCPMIAISGQFRPASAGSSTMADALGVRQVVAKPFSKFDLLAAVRSVIDQPA